MSEYWQLPEYQHLLAEVRAAPDDDLPRLVLAEWLCDRGEFERAEFIRVQCALAKLRGRKDKIGRSVGHLNAPEIRLLSAREYELREQTWYRDEFVPWIHTGMGIGSWTEVRGFVHTVRATLAALVGGECGRCGGAGEWTSYNGPGTTGGIRFVTCPTCSRTGRTPGVLRDLVKREPVRAVEVVDREPQYDGGEHLWASASDTSSWRFDVHRESLPFGIARHLTGGRHHPETRSIVAQWWYPTADAASAALSSAALRWAEQPEETEQ